jgi:hypothetical protein
LPPLRFGTVFYGWGDSPCGLIASTWPRFAELQTIHISLALNFKAPVLLCDSTNTNWAPAVDSTTLIQARIAETSGNKTNAC